MFKISVLYGAAILCLGFITRLTPTHHSYNCYSVALQTFAGTNTLSYPVGVFDIHGSLLGNATTPAAYISLWNNDTADGRLGTLALGKDSTHFNLNLNTGQTLPAGVTGLRYYQVDLPWNQFDGARWLNAVYVDFGDGSGIRMPASESDTPAIHPPNTTYVAGLDIDFYNLNDYYFVHSYPDTSLKTITFYHNDGTENSLLDNAGSPATSLTKLRNLRGNLPAQTNAIGGSSYQQASMTNLQGIINWNLISSVKYFQMNNGDFGINACLNISYPQDFMARDTGLIYLHTRFGNVFGVGDTSFKISRLKSDWNTYFKQLQDIAISDRDWNHEDLTALTHLNKFSLVPNDTDGSINPSGPFNQLDSTEIDNVLDQIAAGAGQTVSNGTILIGNGGHTSASQTSVNLLLGKGWLIIINGVTQVAH